VSFASLIGGLDVVVLMTALPTMRGDLHGDSASNPVFTH
jgi:hypothetical protein